MLSMTGAPRRKIWVDLLLYPTHTLPTAAAPVLVGVGLALHNGVFGALPVLLAFVASWLIHVAGVFTDNYRLLADHPDVVEHPELTAALHDGSLTLNGLWWAIAGCMLGAALAGSYLIAVAGIAAAVLGVIGVAVSLGYSLGPVSLTKLGIADPVFFLMFGIVAVAGVYYVQAGAASNVPFAWHIDSQIVPWDALVVGLPVGAIVTCVLLIDDIRDRAYDAAKGWHTPPVRFGLRWTRTEFTALMAVAYLLPLWFWLGLGFTPWVLLPLVTVGVAFGVTRTICTEIGFEKLFPLTPKTSTLAFVYALLLGAGLAMRG
jgi:1,4-dihydroxy-2-naphthoate octaprenyltransferase